MNKLGVLGIALVSILIMAVQVFVFKDIVLFGSAFCFFYILALLLLPVDTNPLLQIAIGFIVGLLIDTFYNTQGIHAAASTFIMFFRPYWINLLSPGSGYGATVRINIRSQGLQWFLTYTYPLILVHGIFLLFVEAFTFAYFFETLVKAFYSSIFTLISIVVVQYLFLNKEK
ncbi:MAG: rod shape-determining protein MreD [Cyclobacteriaceae bacterium]